MIGTHHSLMRDQSPDKQSADLKESSDNSPSSSPALPYLRWKSTRMEKIDRLGWAAGFSFVSYGRRIGVRSNDPDILGRLDQHLPPGWKRSSSPVVERLYSLVAGGPGALPNVRRLNLLYGDIARLARSRELDEVLETFESNLRLYVAEAARRRLFIHAGVVGWRGRAILIPGRSFSGKTTLVAELVRAGASYYSDEYAVLDADGYVHPYSQPLSLRGPGTARQTKCEVETLGGRRGVKPLPVGMIIVSRYKEGAKWRPRSLSEGLGAMALLNNTVSVRRQPQVAMNTLHKVVSQATILKSVRGEASEAIASILGHANEGKEA
jgi:hypothetical protein